MQRDWSALRAKTAAAVRTHLWNATAAKFTPHLYFETLPANGVGKTGSPFPESFDESALYYHGGTAQACAAPTPAFYATLSSMALSACCGLLSAINSAITSSAIETW